MQEITVGYTRKVSTDNFGSIGASGSVVFKPATSDLQEEFDKAFLHLKLIVDAQLAKISGESGGTFDTAGEPDLGEQPEWVGQHQEEVDQLLAGGGVPPKPAPPSAVAKPESSTQGTVQAVSQGDSETRGRDSEAKPADGEVFLERAKVFRSNIKRSKQTKRPYAELRVGHQDLNAHIGSQYTTVRVFDPQFISVVGSLKRMTDEETGEVVDVENVIIQKDDFVNLWGSFSPWNTDPTKFDMNATAIQKA